MDFIDILTFLQNYSIPTLIISAILSVVGFILDKFVFKKYNLNVGSYAPFILGILIYFIYDSVFVSRYINFSEEVISAGLLCGSISGVIFSCVKHLVHGDIMPLLSANEIGLSIENIIKGYVDQENINTAVTEIKEIAENFFNSIDTESETVNKIAVKIKNYSNKTYSENEYFSLAELILTSIKALKNF